MATISYLVFWDVKQYGHLAQRVENLKVMVICPHCCTEIAAIKGYVPPGCRPA